MRAVGRSRRCHRLRFIRRAKALGFSLEEIGELLALSDHHQQDMGSVRDTAQARLQDIAQRMAELQRMHIALSQLVDACPGAGWLAVTRAPAAGGAVPKVRGRRLGRSL